MTVKFRLSLQFLVVLLVFLYYNKSCLGLSAFPNVTQHAVKAKVIKESQETQKIFKKESNSLWKFLCRGNYQNDLDIRCVENDIFLSIGHCLTYEEKSNKLYEFKCPYFQLDGHYIGKTYSVLGFIKLPESLSDLNDYMCGPMNRRGFLCEECIDNFSVSMTSMGGQCSNCTDVLYGIPLYLAIELVPITVFYLVILVFHIHITSAPMVSFIFYSQLVMLVLAIDRPPPVEKVMPQFEKNFLFYLNLVLYAPWNLDFLRYVLPPFCVFSGLNMEYTMILSCISVLYPLLLIFLTWLCIEAYGRRFKPLVYLVAPVCSCLRKTKREWGIKRDIVDVFSAFFLLSYSRLMYQCSLIMNCNKVTFFMSNSHWGVKYMFNYNHNIACGSSKSIAIRLLSVLIMVTFNLLPALLLVLYPFQVVRTCLSKCRLDTLCLSAFMDKFHGCYRNGLNGDKDMRSFAGLYFFLRCVLFMYYPFKLYELSISFGSYVVFIFLCTTLLIAIARPYRKRYMNIFDPLLLGHLTMLCKVLFEDYFEAMGTHIAILSLLPAFTLGFCLLYVMIAKVYKFMCCKKRGSTNSANPLIENAADLAVKNSDEEEYGEAQPLLTPSSDSIPASDP